MKRGYYAFNRNNFIKKKEHRGAGELLINKVVDASTDPACNFIVMAIIPPGSSVGEHTHKIDEEEIYVIVSGNGEMLIDGKAQNVGPGDIIVNPPGGKHDLKNIGNNELKLVAIEVPVRN